LILPEDRSKYLSFDQVLLLEESLTVRKTNINKKTNMIIKKQTNTNKHEHAHSTNKHKHKSKKYIP